MLCLHNYVPSPPPPTIIIIMSRAPKQSTYTNRDTGLRSLRLGNIVQHTNRLDYARPIQSITLCTRNICASCSQRAANRQQTRSPTPHTRAQQVHTRLLSPRAQRHSHTHTFYASIYAHTHIVTKFTCAPTLYHLWCRTVCVSALMRLSASDRNKFTALRACR